MTKRSKAVLGAAVGLVLAASAPAWSGDAAETGAGFVPEARSIVSGFAERLKAELTGAMKASGPVEAIGVCNTAAPAVAKDASAQGWTVGRTSLRLRNVSNTPDAWEKKNLEIFKDEKAGGADPAKLEKFEIIQKDGVETFRYMKAIVMAEPCLACHGEAIGGPVKAKLGVLYPNDQATGYKPGDIRGAFTLSKAVK